MAGEGEMKATYNPKFLRDALIAMDSELVTLEFVESNSPATVDSGDGETEKYLVMPIRDI